MSPDDPAVAEILRRAMVARIATLSRNRRPHVNPLYFVYVKGRIHLGTVDQTLAVRNVRANAQVAMLFQVERRPRDRRVLRLHGRATVLSGPEADRAYRRAVVRKYYLNWRGLGDTLIHARLLPLMHRYHATHGKGSPCVLEVVPESVELCLSTSSGRRG